MSPQELLSFIHRQGLFDSEIILSRNEFLSRAGQISTDIFLIVEGSVSISIADDAQQRITRLGYENDIIVSLDSFFVGQTLVSRYVRTQKNPGESTWEDSIFNLIDSKPEALKAWSLMLEDLVLQQMERERDLLIASPKERYLRVLSRSPKLFQHIPNRHIANYLRMSPETLSRLKKS